MINWLSTSITVPKSDREIIAINQLKQIGYNSSAKKSKIMKFNKRFDETLIQDLMMSDNLTLWAYVEGEHNE